jgi:hypothetical protein
MVFKIVKHNLDFRPQPHKPKKEMQMKNLRTIFGSLLLVVALSGTALAGDMDTPRAATDSPTSAQVTAQILIDYLMLMF